MSCKLVRVDVKVIFRLARVAFFLSDRPSLPQGGVLCVTIGVLLSFGKRALLSAIGT